MDRYERFYMRYAWALGTGGGDRLQPFDVCTIYARVLPLTRNLSSMPKESGQPTPEPVLANAALAVSTLSMIVFLWGYGTGYQRPDSQIAPRIGYILAGWAGLLLSLFFAVGAMARREGARATTAFYVGLSLISLMFLFAVGRALALFAT